MQAFRRHQLSGVFCVYTVYTSDVSFIYAVSTGNVALVSLRIGEFVNVNIYHHTSLGDSMYRYARKPMLAIKDAPRPKRHAIALLLLPLVGSSEYHQMLGYHLHKFDPQTILAFIKYGVLYVNIYTIVRCGQPENYNTQSLAVQLTCGGSFRQTTDYTDGDYVKGYLYSFRRPTFKRWSIIT